MNLGPGAILDFVGHYVDLIWIGLDLIWFDVDLVEFDWILILIWFDLMLIWYWLNEGLIWFDKTLWYCKQVNVRFEWKSNAHDNAPMPKVEDVIQSWIRRRREWN